MTLINGIGFGISGGFFVATILTRDWLEGVHIENKRLLVADFPSSLRSWNYVNSTVRFMKKYEYSLRHLCIRKKYDHLSLPKTLNHLRRNISGLYKSKEIEKCYTYGHIGPKLPIYATQDIKRFKHVFIYILCAVGLLGLSTTLSLTDIVILRSKKKAIIKYTAISLSFIAVITGMIGVLLARVSPSTESQLEWRYGYSFVLACVGESVLIFMLVYNVLEYYLRTRKRVAEDCEHLTPESYPLQAT